MHAVHAALALATNSLLRSMLGACLPLFASSMYYNISVICSIDNWASTLVAFLALAMNPLPFLFYKFGHSIRMKSKYTREAVETIEKTAKAKEAKEWASETASSGGE